MAKITRIAFLVAANLMLLVHSAVPHLHCTGSGVVFLELDGRAHHCGHHAEDTSGDIDTSTCRHHPAHGHCDEECVVDNYYKNTPPQTLAAAQKHSPYPCHSMAVTAAAQEETGKNAAAKSPNRPPEGSVPLQAGHATASAGRAPPRNANA